jgi:hypothetical protein
MSAGASKRRAAWQSEKPMRGEVMEFRQGPSIVGARAPAQPEVTRMGGVPGRTNPRGARRAVTSIWVICIAHFRHKLAPPGVSWRRQNIGAAEVGNMQSPGRTEGLPDQVSLIGDRAMARRREFQVR